MLHRNKALWRNRYCILEAKNTIYLHKFSCTSKEDKMSPRNNTKKNFHFNIIFLSKEIWIVKVSI